MNKKITKLLIALALTIIPFFLLIKYVEYNLISCILISALLVMLNYNYLCRYKINEINIWSVIFAITFCFCQVIGYNCFTFDNPYLNHFQTWLVIFLLFISLALPIQYCFNIKKIAIINDKKNTNKNCKYNFIKYFVFILLSWIPVLIMYYPGNYAYDAAHQVRMFIGQIPFTAHHPVIHTVILGGIIQFGTKLFSYKAGLLFYSILQMTIMACIFSYVLIFLEKKNIKKIYIMIFLIFYMFLPTFSLMAITTTKDVLFGGIFTLFIIYLYELLVESKNEKRVLISVLIILSLAILMRNNMIYALFLSFPALLIVNKKIITTVCSLSIFIYALATSIFLAIGIVPGSSVEKYSVPLQQLARVYKYKKITSSEKRKVEKILGDTINYNPRISDPVKNTFDVKEYKNNMPKYTKLYLTLGIKNPTTYINSFIMNTYNYFYIYDNVNDWPNPYIETRSMSKEFKHSKLTKKLANSSFNKLVNKSYFKNIPILNVLMRHQSYIWLLIFSIFKMLQNKNYKIFSILNIYFCFLITNLLGPVAIMRYVFNFLCSAPILLYLLFSNYSSSSKKKGLLC